MAKPNAEIRSKQIDIMLLMLKKIWKEEPSLTMGKVFYRVAQICGTIPPYFMLDNQAMIVMEKMLAGEIYIRPRPIEETPIEEPLPKPSAKKKPTGIIKPKPAKKVAESKPAKKPRRKYKKRKLKP